jgi:hypothetical protein
MYTGLRHKGKTSLGYQYTLLKNEGQEGKIGPFWGWVPVEGVWTQGKRDEGEYGGCILNPYMKMEE